MNMSQQWNYCEQRIRLIIIQAGKIIRELQGLPEELNVTILYNETAPLFGIMPYLLTSTPDAIEHLPTPEESARANPDNPYVLHCPACGRKSYFFTELCKNCKASEDGKYKVQFECFECHHIEKSEERLVVWLDRLGIDFTTQSKESLGIKITTDEGIK